MRGLAAGVGVGLVALLALAPVAGANTIVVDDAGDDQTNDGDCTLVEAIVAANDNTASGGMAGECPAGDAEPTVDVINFANPPFTGNVSTTIVTSGLPDVTEDLNISAGTVTGGITKPRVGVRVNPGGSNEALDVANGVGVVLAVDGLAITGADTGIHAEGATLSASDVWIGLSLNQSVALGNNYGIKLGSNSTVGSLGADMPNVFAANGVGIYVQGGDNNTIIRNYFGSKTDGTFTSPDPEQIDNGTNIRIVDNETGPDPATGNVVGGAEPGGSDPNICDGPCNLISNANGDGVDLSGLGGGEDPATGLTTISGNYIGHAFNGVSAIGNDGFGVNVGNAGNVTIGGESDAERNHIAGNGSAGVFSTSDNLAVTRNFFGTNVAGDAAIPGLDSDLEINPGGDGSSISSNRIGGRGFSLFTDNSSLTNNVFGIGTGGEDLGHGGPGDGATPLSIIGSGNTIGGVGAGNTIGNHKLAGGDPGAVSIGGHNNDVLGNFIGVDAAGNPHPNASNGITLAPGGADSDGNDIGGVAAGAGNTISNSARDAIHLSFNGSGSNGNEFRGNLGRSNGSGVSDLFIDLGSDGAGNGDGGFPPAPNETVQAPAIGSVDGDDIQGTSPEPLPDGSLVDVYKTFTLRGDVKEYLGTATISSGAWSFTYPTPLAAGTCVAVTQTSLAGSTSEMATVAVGGGPCDVTGPTASVATGPSGPTNDPTPTFGLSASEPGSSFECSIDSGPFNSCSAAFTVPALGDGPHNLVIRATDPVGNLGSDSAPRNFTVDTAAPSTSLDSAVRKAKRRRITISFSSEAGATFLCRLNNQPFAPCTSPKTYRRLKRGKRHKVEVKAVDAVGNADATPASAGIRVPRRRPG